MKQQKFCFSRFLLFSLLFFLFSLSSLSAIDFLLRPRAFLFIPMGQGNLTNGGLKRWQIGGGAEASVEVDIASILPNPIGLGYTAGFEAGFSSNRMMGDVRNGMPYSFGAIIGVYYFPLSRLFLRIDGSLGVFIPTFDGLNGPAGFFYRVGTEAGYRFTPQFLLSANVSWRQYGVGQNAWNSGLSIGIAAQLTIRTGRSSASEGVQVSLEQHDLVYPAFLQLYQTVPIGTLTVRNMENAEIRNVRLRFAAGRDTASEFQFAEISVIPKGGSVEVPLYADFSSNILNYTADSNTINGTVIVYYNFLGQEQSPLQLSVIIESHSRNAVFEGDLAALGAFISPTSFETQDFSNYVAGLARARLRSGHNEKMQIAIWLFEGLRASGIRVGDNYLKENEVQFPSETLIAEVAIGTGSQRDIAVLYASALESVGIRSAIINIGTDFIIALNLEIGEAAAETLFSSTDKILNIDGTIWLPVAMSSFNDGFIASWTRAAVTLNDAFERGEFVDFITVAEAWYLYPPAPLSNLGAPALKVESSFIIAESRSAIDQYIAQDIMPLVWRVEAQIASAPTAASQPTAALYNRLGILLNRAGRTADAARNYERAAGMGSVAAMTNRGNLALNERDYDTAEYWFRRALQIDSGNRAALNGLDRVEGRR